MISGKDYYKVFVRKLFSGNIDFFDTMYHYIEIIYHRLLPIVFGNRKAKYPYRSRFLYKHIINNYKEISSCKCSPTPLGFPYYLKTPLGEVKVQRDFDWSSLADLTSDEEYIFSLHRWYWLVYDYSQLQATSTDDLKRLISHWIQCNPYDEKHPAWETYSCSERISSLTMALLIKDEKDCLFSLFNSRLEFQSFLNQSIHHIGRNLEYFYGGITFNHVINDLKGLVVAGLIKGDVKLVELALDLLLIEAEIILDGDGFIREGSSHYQFVITRWICELEFVMQEFESKALVQRISTLRIKLINTLSFFVVYNKYGAPVIPLFGDISPDFPPTWLLDYFEFGGQAKTSYGCEVLNKLKIRIYDDSKERECLIRSKKSFTRVDHQSWTLFARHGFNEGTYFPSHSHDDYSSVVLFYNGLPVIIDPGRKSYTTSSFNDPFCKANIHNCSTINGFSLSLGESFYYLPPSYKKTEFSLDFKEEDTTELVIQTKRIKHIDKIRVLSTTKKIVISDSNVCISEFFDTESRNFRINSGINFSADWHVSEANSGRSYDFLRGGDKLRLTVREDLDLSLIGLIHCAQKYGAEMTCNRFDFSPKHDICRNIDYTISILNLYEKW